MRPHENQIIGRSQQGAEIRRYDDMPPIAGMSGDWEACALYAGESAGIIREIKSASSIVDDIVRDALKTIRSLARVDLDEAFTDSCAGKGYSLSASQTGGRHFAKEKSMKHIGISIGPVAASVGYRCKDPRHPPHALPDLLYVE
jgi:hypothetical protein